MSKLRSSFDTAFFFFSKSLHFKFGQHILIRQTWSFSTSKAKRHPKESGRPDALNSFTPPVILLVPRASLLLSVFRLVFCYVIFSCSVDVSAVCAVALCFVELCLSVVGVAIVVSVDLSGPCSFRASRALPCSR